MSVGFTTPGPPASNQGGGKAGDDLGVESSGLALLI